MWLCSRASVHWARACCAAFVRPRAWAEAGVGQGFFPKENEVEGMLSWLKSWFFLVHLGAEESNAEVGVWFGPPALVLILWGPGEVPEGLRAPWQQTQYGSTAALPESLQHSFGIFYYLPETHSFDCSFIQVVQGDGSLGKCENLVREPFAPLPSTSLPLFLLKPAPRPVFPLSNCIYCPRPLSRPLNPNMLSPILYNTSLCPEQSHTTPHPCHPKSCTSELLLSLSALLETSA